MNRCAGIPPLLGHAVALTGHRRSEELGAHVQALGAEVIVGPMVHTRPVSDDDRTLRQATGTIISDPPDFLVATTGIGVRGWINAAAAWRARQELLRVLGGARILARGPKVVGALTEAGLNAWFTAQNGRSSTLAERLVAEGVAGAHVAIQLPGDAMDDVVATLEAAGARVTTIPVYEWTWPEDLEPARRVLRAIAGRRVSAVTFTSRPAVRNFLALAEGDDEVLEALRDDVLAVCVGPSTADPLWAAGIEPRCPEMTLLGELGPVIADGLRDRGHHHVLATDGSDVVVQGRLVDGGGISVVASDREAALLNRLIGPPRRTVSRADLLRSVWRAEEVDPSVLDATVARLRRRIAGTGLGIQTVAGRGYLLGGDVLTTAPSGCR